MRRTRFGWQPQVVDRVEPGVANWIFARTHHRNGARWAGRAISSLKACSDASRNTVMVNLALPGSARGGLSHKREGTII
jgi:hypothetical protein